MVKISIHLTKSEADLMEFFWSKSKPLTSVDILKSDTERPWNDSYLHLMLSSLIKKGLIKVCGSLQYGTQYARQFIPTITKEEFMAKLIVTKGKEKKSIAKIMVAMAKEVNYDENLIKQLEEIVEEFKEKGTEDN